MTKADEMHGMNELRARSDRALNAILRALILASLIAIVAGIFQRSAPLANVIALVVMLAYIVGLYALQRRGRYQLAAPGLVFGLIALATFTTAAYGSIRGAGTLVYLIAIASGGILLGRRALLAAAGLSIAALAVLVHAQLAGWLPVPNLEENTARHLH